MKSLLIACSVLLDGLAAIHLSRKVMHIDIMRDSLLQESSDLSISLKAEPAEVELANINN